MDKVADLIRKLSIAAAAEGKSVTVIVCPTTVDIHEERDAIGGVAFSCIMAALRAPSVSGLGALNTDALKSAIAQ